MKKFFYFFALSAIVLGMASCGDGNDPALNNVPEGAVKGVFTVGNGKRVFFSKGNLQYKALTATGDDEWRFASRQWDYVGNATKGTVNEAGVKSNNLLIADDYSGWIDLFGWGTGKNPTNTSKDVSDYPYVEWGNRPISNGGNKANSWRTLFADEWMHLFILRDNAETLFAYGSIEGINGIILLPDHWQKLGDVPFTPSTQCEDENLGKMILSSSKDNYRCSNKNGAPFQHNTYTEAQWKKMEDAGAVFLPAAGWRSGDDVGGFGVVLDYWSASSNQEGASAFEANENIISPNVLYSKSQGFSVRLVCDVK